MDRSGETASELITNKFEPSLRVYERLFGFLLRYKGYVPGAIKWDATIRVRDVTATKTVGHISLTTPVWHARLIGRGSATAYKEAKKFL